MEIKVRAVDTNIGEIRRKVFTEVAKLAYDGDYGRIDELPYRIIQGEKSRYRSSIFLERAIVGERIRLAIGLPLRSIEEHAPLSMGIMESAINEKYFDAPLINIIKFACNACPDKFVVSDCCQGCLAHPCAEVCPKDAVSIVNGRSSIDQQKCIKCGRCKEACPYEAIVHLHRPCARACGVNAIEGDDSNRAVINYDKCVACGMCIVNCPFGAISDKGQIFQLIHSLKKGDNVVAMVAPSFIGQFKTGDSFSSLAKALKKLGFQKVVEVAVGADICAIEEAKDFLEMVPREQPFMATSCCPSWIMMVKREFPNLSKNISMTLTPMVITARQQKKECPNCKVVFIGPCSSKKLEASDKEIRSDVDFVITYEELFAMFEARNISVAEEEAEDIEKATALGRGFPVSGGVADAVVKVANQMNPTRQIKVASAEGLIDCKKLIKEAARGEYHGYLLEGMACTGGCVAGTGTLCDVKKAASILRKYKEKAGEAIEIESINQ